MLVRGEAWLCVPFLKKLGDCMQESQLHQSQAALQQALAMGQGKEKEAMGRMERVCCTSCAVVCTAVVTYGLERYRPRRRLRAVHRR